MVGGSIWLLSEPGRRVLAVYASGARAYPSDREFHPEMRERRAGIFYVAPCGARYEFAHPEATGKTSSPFHGVWACGGWGGEVPPQSDRTCLLSARGWEAGSGDFAACFTAAS